MDPVPSCTYNTLSQALDIWPLLTTSSTQASPQPCITSPTEDYRLNGSNTFHPEWAGFGLDNLNKWIFTPADLWQTESEKPWERVSATEGAHPMSYSSSQEYNPGILAPSPASLLMKFSAFKTLAKNTFSKTF